MQKEALTKSSAPRSAAVTSPVPSNSVSVVAKTDTPTKNSPPSREQIAQRAYEIYVARGQTSGHELEDWTQAERELSAKSHRYN